MVADSVLDEDDALTTSTISEWLTLYQNAAAAQDIELMIEYGHMKPLKEASLPLHSLERGLLRNSMMSRNYWADQHCLRIIEEKTRLRFIVLDDETLLPRMCWYHSNHYMPQYYVFLLLQGSNHYVPVSYRGQYIFKWTKTHSDIPPELQAFTSLGYKQKI